MADAIKAIVGPKVMGKGGKEIAVEDFCGEGKIVGLYFSAHWCPPCRAFTPKLAQFYEKVHESKKLEIVFVSCDEAEKEFEEYCNMMPWLAMPFDDKYKQRDEVCNNFHIAGIPMLIFLDGANGKVITENGREEVQNDLTGDKFPSWKQ